MSEVEKKAKGDVAPSWKINVDKGEFKRAASAFRARVTADGSSGFKAESGRYHLYVSLACPWAHRTLIMRNFKGLQDVISVTIVDWNLGEKGWAFTEKSQEKPLCSPDPINGFQYLRQVYNKHDPTYEGRVTVPVLFDKKTQKIVNNESSEIIRILNSEFNELCSNPDEAKLDFYPEPLRGEIDSINDWVYNDFNNGVYKAGFATTQEAYEKAVKGVFAALDKVEAILAKRRYLCGSQLTEADIRIFTTLIRFDAVYFGHFKCNIRRIRDYPNLYNYLKELYHLPQIHSTVNFVHIKHHYYYSHTSINPHRIVPVGPDLSDLEIPTRDRERLGD